MGILVYHGLDKRWFVYVAQYQVNFVNLLHIALRSLGVATSSDNGCARVAPSRGSKRTAGLTVGDVGYGARVQDIHICLLIKGDKTVPRSLKLLSQLQ